MLSTIHLGEVQASHHRSRENNLDFRCASRHEGYRQGTDWKLLHLNDREYEIHRTDGATFIFFTGILADNDAMALQKAIDVVTTADKKSF